jgi:hypothetical protein
MARRYFNRGEIVNHCSHEHRPGNSLIIGFALTLTFACAIALSPHAAGATIVSGNFIYRNGKPGNDRQLHLENRATNDIYVAACNSDGTFSADVPPGLYDLRAERGVILKYRIRVEEEPINVGRVIEPVPLDVHRLFQRQSIAEAIVKSPAPTTANMTGRPMQALQFGHEAAEQYGAPVGTPVSRMTPGAKGVEGMESQYESPPVPVPPAPQL